MKLWTLIKAGLVWAAFASQAPTSDRSRQNTPSIVAVTHKNKNVIAHTIDTSKTGTTKTYTHK